MLSSDREANKNRQLESMLKAARDRLRTMDPDAIAMHAGVHFSDGIMLLPSMGQTYKLDMHDWSFDQPLEMWHYLTLLQYLFTADGTPLAGRWISLAEMPGGIARGTGFNKDIGLMFERGFGGINAETFMQACAELGGKPAQTNADAGMIIPYAPNFPILLNFWESDDEFPCSGKALADANGSHYLTVEAAGGACASAVQRLSQILAAGKK